MDEQHSLGWFRTRLGNFTGSQVGKLMQSGKKKDEYFGTTAMSYIYKIAAERSMNDDIVNDDFMFTSYLEQVNVTSKAMQWGTDNEADARDLFAKIKGDTIEEVGSIKHENINFFASSPDGVCNEKGYCIEIKCPNQETFMKYKDKLKSGESLQTVEPLYFYQCQSHMMCTGFNLTYFIIYNPYQAKPISYFLIERDEDVIKQITERIDRANTMVDIINMEYGENKCKS